MSVVWELPEECDPAPGSDRAGRCALSGTAESLFPLPDRALDQIVDAAPSQFVLSSCNPSTPSALDIISSANARGLRVTCRIKSSATMDKIDYDRLREAGVRGMALTLDGAAAQTHDAASGIPGSWTRTMQAYTAARRARLSVQLRTTFTRSNLKEWWKLVRLMRSLQVERWLTAILVPHNEADIELVPDPAQTEALLRGLCALSHASGLPVSMSDAPHFHRVLVQSRATAQHGAEPWHVFPLNDGRGRLFITRHGDVLPGEKLPIACGNVRTESLVDIYRDSPVFQRLRNSDLLKGKCGRCEFRAVCGGSRARAYAITGDYLAEESTCAHKPRHARLQILPGALHR